MCARVSVTVGCTHAVKHQRGYLHVMTLTLKLTALAVSWPHTQTHTHTQPWQFSAKTACTHTYARGQLRRAANRHAVAPHPRHHRHLLRPYVPAAAAQLLLARHQPADGLAAPAAAAVPLLLQPGPAAAAAPAARRPLAAAPALHQLQALWALPKETAP